jgi:hypothetical protein
MRIHKSGIALALVTGVSVATYAETTLPLIKRSAKRGAKAGEFLPLSPHKYTVGSYISRVVGRCRRRRPTN